MALNTNEEEHARGLYQNSIIELQIEALTNDMWAEIDLIVKKKNDNDKWYKRRQKKVEYYERVQELLDQKV